MTRLLTRTLESPYFSEAARIKRLLSYLVNEEVMGRGEQLSVYGVAFDVFDRTADFDPQKNSLVRVEMRRLRQMLDAWAHDPRNPDRDRLLVGPGQYRPTVSPRDDTLPPDGEAAVGSVWAKPRWGRRAAIALSAALMVVVAGIVVHAASQAQACRSERPTLALPEQIPNLSDERIATLLLGQIDQFIDYYPLVDIANGERSECDGAPRYKLKLLPPGRHRQRGALRMRRCAPVQA